MAPLYSEGFDEILNAASQYDDYVQERYCMFMAEEDWQTLYQFFDRDNYAHYDEWEEKEVSTDYKRLKKILRGKDMVSLIQFAFDLGRLVGRAHHVLEMES